MTKPLPLFEVQSLIARDNPSPEFDLVGPLETLDADSRETIPRRVPAHPTAGLNRRTPNMRHKYDPFLPDEGMIRPNVGFTGRDVQPGRSESTLPDGLDERLRINHGSTRWRVSDVSGQQRRIRSLSRAISSYDAAGRISIPR